jgi:hypothetical protein
MDWKPCVSFYLLVVSRVGKVDMDCNDNLEGGTAFSLRAVAQMHPLPWTQSGDVFVPQSFGPAIKAALPRKWLSGDSDEGGEGDKASTGLVASKATERDVLAWCLLLFSKSTIIKHQKAMSPRKRTKTIASCHSLLYDAHQKN